jgi:peptidyl-prolyl cis-trans isomerase C
MANREGIMKKWIIVIGLLVFWVAAVQAEEKDVVAKVGGKAITKVEFEQLLKRRGGEPPLDKKMKMDLLNNLVQTIALGDAARGKGLDKRKDVQEIVKLSTDSVLANILIKEEVLDKVSVTEEQAKNYYEKHLAQFKIPEKARVRHIMIKAEKSATDDVKKKARERAEEVLKKIKAGEDFAKLAMDYSDDPGSKAKGGDLGFFEKGKMFKAFDEAAFKLNPGEVSDIVETAYGFHIIKMDEKKKEEIQPYESVKDKVMTMAKDEIKAEKMKEYLSQVMKQADIKIFSEVLDGEKN